MNISEAKKIDLVAYLASNGHEPVRTSGTNLWYRSPFREERTASFKVNKTLNNWYDFGEGTGGDIVDFVMKNNRVPTPEALKILQVAQQLPAFEKNETKSPQLIQILKVESVTSTALIRYAQNREVPYKVLSEYAREVQFLNGNKQYYALGFKNDAGGYELRSPYFKGSSSPKSPTHIENGADKLTVFEGFFDFLSYITMRQTKEATPTTPTDFLVLNSTSFFNRQLPKMQTYGNVDLYLNNDDTGRRCATKAVALEPEKFNDQSKLYSAHNDLNEWLIAQQKEQYKALPNRQPETGERSHQEQRERGHQHRDRGKEKDRDKERER